MPKSKQPKVFPLYKYFVGTGNNSELVKIVLASRPWWSETTEQKGANLFWQQWTPRLDYYQNQQRPQHVANHMAGNIELHSKLNLYKSFLAFVGSKAFRNIMPTYELSGADRLRFEAHFSYLQNKNLKQQELNNTTNDSSIPRSRSLTPSVNCASTPIAVKSPSLRSRHQAELAATPSSRNPQNLWILKPEGLNRGHGIKVVSTLQEVDEHIGQCRATSVHLPQLKQSLQRQAKKTQKPTLESIQNAQTHQLFLAQKYIEDPLLYKKRKFDIRCYGLVTSRGDFFVYERGYLRLTAQEYDATSKDPAAHLTNNAVQQLVQHYGEFEEGNMASFDDLDAEILKQQPEMGASIFTKNIWPEIQKLVKQMFLAVGQKILKDFPCTNCFELFGFDFMITQQLQPMLIEANVNPCLELASPLSWWILPSMLDDLFSITIDKTFAPPHQLNPGKNAPQFQCKTLQQWRDTPPSERQVEGLRYQLAQTNMTSSRPNEWKQVVKSWVGI